MSRLIATTSSRGERNYAIAITLLLLLGNASPVGSLAGLGALVSGVSASAVFNAASSAISAGATVSATLQALENSGFGVTCSIQVENWTKFPLMYPVAQVNGQGALVTTPRAILPGKKETFGVRKPSHSATGVSGVVSWEVRSLKQRFVLMWSAPYNFNLHSNWLGLGMTRVGLTQPPSGQQWFDQMYYKTSSTDLTFVRGEYYYSTRYLIYRDSNFEIVGLMNNIHEAKVEVVFRPVEGKWDLLADSFEKPLKQIIGA